MKQTMNQVLVFLLSVYLVDFVESQVDTTGCSPIPLSCFNPVSARDRCSSDADCSSGMTCCYKSCFKKCVSRRPCSNVVCRPGYLCQVVSTPCTTLMCRQEASCLPAEQVNCPQDSTYPGCGPGFERSKDRYGCRSGPCQAKRNCPPSCRIFCAYGQMLDANGCPSCQCKPAPQSPCSNLGCSSTQECRFMSTPPTNTVNPAFLQAGCVSNSLIPTVIDKSCSLKNPTTSGLPVLDITANEIDCATTSCPPNSVCVAITPNMHRCCWQHSQMMVSSGPKIGECPPSPMLPYNIQSQMCEIDANCPDTYKCCYIDRERGRTTHVGICLPPIHVTLSDSQLCGRNDGKLWFFMIMGVC